MKKIRVDIQSKPERPISGYVVLNIPKPSESAKLGQAFQFKEKNGELVERTNAEKMDYLYEMAEKHCVEVSILTEGGLRITSVEDLGYDEDGRVLLQEIGSMVFKGVKLSPKSFAQ